MDHIIAYPPRCAAVGVPRAVDARSILLLTLSLTTFMCPLKGERHVQLGLNTGSAFRQDVPARHQLIAAILKARMKGRRCKTARTLVRVGPHPFVPRVPSQVLLPHCKHTWFALLRVQWELINYKQ